MAGSTDPGSGQGLGQPGAALAHQPSRAPEADERAGQPQGQLDLAGADRPGERGADVVVLLVEPVEPEGLVRARQLRLRGLDQLEEALGMAAAELVELTALLEPLERVLANRLQQTEAGLALGAVPLPDEALVDERREGSNDSPSAIPSPATASASSSEQPPAKTPSRASSVCSAGSSRL